TYDQHSYSSVDASGNTVNIKESVPRTKVSRNWLEKAVPGIVQFGHGPEGYPYEFYYEAKLNALVTDGKAEILARPNITTIQGREAVINIGGSVPVPTVSTTDSTTTTSMEYKDAGIILRYTPRVNDDGYITAEVHTEVSSPLYVEEMKAYRFQRRSADTMVRLRDGETMVIGGLIGSEESRSMSKIPFLGDLPVLGAFFRSVRHSKSETELMIFLTAHVLD
ncbi:MAG: type II and III secretion system protein, partial [Selenomonadaceae bacterium]|nr:type II and III secretion system protein [Selenomonadaceae bacterium]